MVAARSVAMAFNRVLDADIDARNPRTRMRHLPTGALSRGFTWTFVGVACLVFLFAARELNSLCLRLAPAALVLLFFYSFTKRFTAFSHLISPRKSRSVTREPTRSTTKTRSGATT